MNLPEELLKHPHFSRYYRTWNKNPLSLVFVPLAQICREQGLLSEAREICEQGLAHHPHSVSGRLMLAKIYFDLEELDQAKKLAEEILQEMPAQGEARLLLERIQRCPRAELVEASTPTREELIQTKGITASLWENVTMAQIYADQGEVKVARQILDRILTRDATHSKARQLREGLK